MRHLLWFCLAAFLPVPSSACQLVEYAHLPVHFTAENLPIVDVSAGGHILHLLLDTGAQASLLTPAAEKTLAVYRDFSGFPVISGFNGMALTHAVTIPKMQIGDILVGSATFLVSNADIGADGILGESFLNGYDIGLDFPHDEVSLYQPDHCTGALPWGGNFAALNFTPAEDDAPQINFYIDSKRFTALIDSGASTVTIRQAVLARKSIATGSVMASTMAQGVGGKPERVDIYRFDTLTIGGETFGGSWLRVAKVAEFSGADAVIGENYLRTHQVFIDNAAGKIYLGTVLPPAPN